MNSLLSYIVLTQKSVTQITNRQFILDKSKVAKNMVCLQLLKFNIAPYNATVSANILVFEGLQIRKFKKLSVKIQR